MDMFREKLITNATAKKSDLIEDEGKKIKENRFKK